MYVQAYVHDLRAQDPPCLSGTSSFKRSLHHALALPGQRAGIAQASHTSVRGKWAIKGQMGVNLGPA